MYIRRAYYVCMNAFIIIIHLLVNPFREAPVITINHNAIGAAKNEGVAEALE